MKKITLFLALGCAVQFVAIESAKAPDQDIKKGWEEARGKEREEKKQQENPSIVKTGKQPVSLAFSPDGKFAAVANFLDNTISVYAVNSDTGTFIQIQGSPFPASSPYSIAFSPSGNIIATNNLLNNSINVYKFDSVAGRLMPVAGSPFKTDGNRPCSVSFLPNGKFAAVVNEHSANIAVYAVHPDTGVFTPVKGSPFETGQFSNSVSFLANGRFAVVPSSQNNDIRVYTVDPNTGSFNLIANPLFPTGQNPYKLAVSSKENFVAVINKGIWGIAGTISAYVADPNTGVLTQIPGSPFAAGNNLSSIAFSPHGRFLAVTNSESHNVTMYNVNPNTGVTQVPGSPFATGKNPSLIAFSPNGHIAAVTNQEDNTLAIYQFNQETGALTPITGDMLEVHKRAKKVHEALIKPGIIPDDVGDIISQYLGSQPAREEQNRKTEEEINKEIAQDRKVHGEKRKPEDNNCDQESNKRQKK